LQNPKGIQIQN